MNENMLSDCDVPQQNGGLPSKRGRIGRRDWLWGHVA